MNDKDTISGDLKMLSLAVKALIDTHPDKETFHRAFLSYVDNPESAGQYTSGLGQMGQDVSLLQSLLQSASKRN